MKTALLAEFGDKKVYLNEAFIIHHKREKYTEKILDAYELKLFFYSLLENAINELEIKDILEDLELVEFEIQKLFGFPENRDYHRFWEYPGCTCPYYDNVDRWGIAASVYSASCKLHGVYSK